MGSSMECKVPDELDPDFKNDNVKFCENYFKKEDVTDQYPQHLEDLYNKCLPGAAEGIFHYENMKERFGDSITDDTLRTIGRYLGILLKDDCCNIYNKHKENKQNEKRKVDMYQHYFICAVLMNKTNIAVGLMEKQSALYSALYAAALLKQLSLEADRQGNMELAEIFSKNQTFFERHACDNIKKMYNEDKTNKEMSQNELTKEHDMFGSTLKTVMRFAEYYDIMDFIATTACQTKSRGIWTGKLSNNTNDLQVVYRILCPVLICSLRFKADSSEKQPSGCCNSTSFNNGKAAIYYFYTAAVTKFWINTIWYFLLLLIFSLFVLTDLHPLSEKQPSVSEIITWIWMFNLIIEECRQIAQIETPTLRFKVKWWWSKVWNKFDAVMFAMMALSVALRLSLGPENFVWARRAYSITLATFILRTWQFFLIGKYTGPKVIMIGEMIKDLLFFVMLFSVVLISFGIILRANLYPNSKASFELLTEIVYMPYWQIYGELFLDTIKENDDSPCRNASEILSDLPVCPDSDSKKFALLALAIYMVFTNIMLLNLLIAMFSNSFHRIQTNAVTIWKFHQYTIVNEYSDRPSMIPPFLILNHVYRLIKYVERKYRCPCRESPNAENKSNDNEEKMEDNKRTETDTTINLEVTDSSEDV